MSVELFTRLERAGNNFPVSIADGRGPMPDEDGDRLSIGYRASALGHHEAKA
jgi:hypothetical protein